MELSKWTVVTEERDPFIADRQPGVMCDPVGHDVEDFGGELSYTVRTMDCGYLTLEQPAVDGADKGELMHLRLWHFELFSLDGPAQAHVVVRVGAATLLDTTVPIPSSSALIAPYLEVPESFGPGTPLLFHLSNHGSNTWNLLELSAGVQPPGAAMP